MSHWKQIFMAFPVWFLNKCWNLIYLYFNLKFFIWAGEVNIWVIFSVTGKCQFGSILFFLHRCRNCCAWLFPFSSVSNFLEAGPEFSSRVSRLGEVKSKQDQAAAQIRTQAREMGGSWRDFFFFVQIPLLIFFCPFVIRKQPQAIAKGQNINIENVTRLV